MINVFMVILITIIYYKLSIPKIISFSIASVFIIVLLSDVFGGILYSQYEARATKMDISYLQREARFREYITLPLYLKENMGTREVMLGNGFGVTYEYRKQYLDITNRDRSIHTDIVKLIYYLGITGSIIYILFYSKLYLILRRASAKIKASSQDIPKVFIPLSYAMIIILITIQVFGGVFSSISGSFLAFSILGFMYGLLTQKGAPTKYSR
jgi:hypothetical protein